MAEKRKTTTRIAVTPDTLRLFGEFAQGLGATRDQAIRYALYMVTWMNEQGDESRTAYETGRDLRLHFQNMKRKGVLSSPPQDAESGSPAQSSTSGSGTEAGAGVGTEAAIKPVWKAAAVAASDSED